VHSRLDACAHEARSSLPRRARDKRPILSDMAAPAQRDAALQSNPLLHLPGMVFVKLLLDRDRWGLLEG
jgi:hypothetical protein